MKVVLGLGNPGGEYAVTRHNIGIMLVEKIFNVQCSIFKDNYGWRRKKNMMVAEFLGLVLVKTSSYFMNESGNIIRDLKNDGLFNKQPDFYLAHDDLDIKLGEYKIQFGTGPKVHNGVESVENALGTKDFWRIRIGIDNRKPENRIPGEDYVLQKFSHEEKEILDKVIEEIAGKVVAL
jgi:peptidyl-tRNA hydrolase, PTH1 family